MQTYKEVWKDIPDYEGIYEVSNLGRVRRLNKSQCKHLSLKPDKGRKGYVRVKLYKDGRCKSFNVHRLVLMAFKGNSNLTVNHINGIKTDNRLINLEYCSNHENILHATKNGLRESKLNEEQARRIKYGKERPSILAREYSITMTLVSRIRRGLTWKHI